MTTHDVDYRALKARAIKDLDEALAALDAEHGRFCERVDEAFAAFHHERRRVEVAREQLIAFDVAQLDPMRDEVERMGRLAPPLPPGAEGLATLLAERPDAVWRLADLHAVAVRRGVVASNGNGNGATRVALGRLVRQGLAARVGRGQYRYAGPTDGDRSPAPSGDAEGSARGGAPTQED